MTQPNPDDLYGAVDHHIRSQMRDPLNATAAERHRSAVGGMLDKLHQYANDSSYRGMLTEPQHRQQAMMAHHLLQTGNLPTELADQLDIYRGHQAPDFPDVGGGSGEGYGGGGAAA